MKLSLLSLVALAVAVSSVACSGEGIDPLEPSEGAEDAITSAVLPGVAAIDLGIRTRPTGGTLGKVVGGPTIAASAKVATLMKALKATTASAPRPSCGPTSETSLMTFRDDKGAELASLEYRCSFGTVHINKGNKDVLVLVRTSAVDAVEAAPLVPADILFGVDAIEITKPQQPNKKVTVTRAAEVEALLGVMDLQNLDPHVSTTRCLPSFVVFFQKKSKPVAATSFSCSSGTPPASIVSSFSKGTSAAGMEPMGGLKLDPRPVVKAYEDAR